MTPARLRFLVTCGLLIFLAAVAFNLSARCKTGEAFTALELVLIAAGFALGAVLLWIMPQRR